MYPLPFRMTARAAAIAGAALSGSAALASIAACSFIVTDSLPGPIACATDKGPGVCPEGQVCQPSPSGVEGTCQPLCNATTPCQPGWACDPMGWCVQVAGDGSPAEAGADAALDGDTSLAEAGADVGDAGSPAQGDAGGTDTNGGCHGFACACSVNADCDVGFACVNKAAATADIWSALGYGDAGGAGGVCMEPCCTSSDCDYSVTDGGEVDADVCFATGAGGNYCVPPALLGDRSTIDVNKSGGSPCGGDAGACRSGLCVSGSCADTCCDTKSSTECATGYCRFGAFPGGGFDKHQTGNCTVPANAGTTAGGGQCGTGGDCRSNLCLGGDGGFMSMNPTCRDACRSRDSCTPSGTLRSQTCNYIQPFPGSPDVVAACVPLGQGGGDGGAGDGMPCRTSTDCAHGYCATLPGGQGVCLGVCFFDTAMTSLSDCPSGERCRPQAVLIGGATYSVLACGM